MFLSWPGREYRMNCSELYNYKDTSLKEKFKFTKKMLYLIITKNTKKNDS